MSNDLISLFPTPLLICQYPDTYEDELDYIINLPCERKNFQKESEKFVKYNRQSNNTFVLNEPRLKKIRNFIEEKIQHFVREIMLSSDNLIITQSWVNKSSLGESHHEHVHPNSLVSGVWYPVINENLPPIQFNSKKQRDVSLSHIKYNNFNSATFLLPLKPGELIIFPSNLHHCVPTNQSNSERISLSFNTWAKGSLGDINSLTYLPLEQCV